MFHPTIKKQTLLELAHLCRKYAETGDVDLLERKISSGYRLSKEAFGSDRYWTSFSDFIDAMCGIYPIVDRCTDERLCEILAFIGYSVKETESERKASARRTTGGKPNEEDDL